MRSRELEVITANGKCDVVGELQSKQSSKVVSATARVCLAKYPASA